MILTPVSEGFIPTFHSENIQCAYAIFIAYCQFHERSHNSGFSKPLAVTVSTWPSLAKRPLPSGDCAFSSSNSPVTTKHANKASRDWLARPMALSTMIASGEPKRAVLSVRISLPRYDTLSARSLLRSRQAQSRVYTFHVSLILSLWNSRCWFHPQPWSHMHLRHWVIEVLRMFSSKMRVRVSKGTLSKRGHVERGYGYDNNVQ